MTFVFFVLFNCYGTERTGLWDITGSEGRINAAAYKNQSNR